MASLLEHDDPHDMDEQRHMQVASVLDGMDDDEDDDNEQDNHECDDESVDESDEESNGVQNFVSSNERRMLKMLVSDNVAGAIIGKSGQTIADMQEQSNARIKVSQTGEFFPGTNERIVLISGAVQSILDAQELIWDKISQYGKSRFNRREPPHHDNGNEMAVGKILVPNDAGGLIIGRAGATIKGIHEESGAKVQINGKDEVGSKISKERVLTVSGAISQTILHSNELLTIL